MNECELAGGGARRGRDQTTCSHRVRPEAGARVVACVAACVAFSRKSPRAEAETETYRGPRRPFAACGGSVYVVSGCGGTPAGSARGALGREGWGPKNSGPACREGLGGRAPRAGGREGRGRGGA
eukprot:bmy_00582T0